MKKYLLILITIMASLVITSCGNDDPADEPVVNPSELAETIKLKSQTIAEGQEVIAAEVTEIKFTYGASIKLGEKENITLNGTKITNATISGTVLTVPVVLEEGKTYTLIITSGTIVSTTLATTAPTLTLNFKTKEKVDTSKAAGVTKMIGYGWNLGNHFDTSWSDNIDFAKPKWGYWDKATPTEALYQNLAKAGVKTVRMPATWGPYQKNESGYPIDDDYMKEVKQNVLWAKNAGLNVILNTHHDEYWMDAYAAASSSTTNDDIKARIKATWTQIAEAFKNEGDYLILESFNELNHSWQTPTDGELRIQNEWNQLVVDAIRATGSQNSTRWIAVPSYQASPTYALSDKFQLPSDPANKLIVAVHCYDPYNFTLSENLEEAWGHSANKSSDEAGITSLFAKIKTRFLDNNIPCYLGEFGSSYHKTAKGIECQNYYLEYFCRAAYFAGLSLCLWDNNNPGAGAEHHAYFSHNDGSWSNDGEAIIPIMVKAATSTDASYTLESIYARAPKK